MNRFDAQDVLSAVKEQCSLIDPESECKGCPFKNVVENLTSWCPFKDVPAEWVVDESLITKRTNF